MSSESVSTISRPWCRGAIGMYRFLVAMTCTVVESSTQLLMKVDEQYYRFEGLK